MKAFACSALLFLMACAPHPGPRTRYRVSVVVRTDRLQPVPGAVIAVDDAHNAPTDSHGDASLQVDGREGQRIRLTVTCPERFRPHAGPIDSALRTLGKLDGGGQRAVNIETTCLPAVRTGVLLVRSQGATAIPVWIDGVLAGQTGANQVAHIPLTLVPGGNLRVTLDTSATPRLRPVSPSHRFVVEDRDGVLVLDQAFTQVTPKRLARVSVPPPELPYRVESGAAVRSGLRVD